MDLKQRVREVRAVVDVVTWTKKNRRLTEKAGNQRAGKSVGVAGGFGEQRARGWFVPAY